MILSMLLALAILTIGGVILGMDWIVIVVFDVLLVLSFIIGGSI